MKATAPSLLAFLLTCTLLPAQVAAFCGFYVGGADKGLYNDATQVVLMRDGKTTVISMQNAYEGPPENFAMVVPVPEVLQKENVKTLEKRVFDKVDRLSAPRLVEYWEQDPCAPQYREEMEGAARGSGGFRKMKSVQLDMGNVVVEAQFKVGEYDIVVLSTNEATALEKWLTTNKYVIPKGAAPYFQPYVESGTYFFVAKVDVKRVKFKDGKAVLSPLRFHYSEEKFQLPIRLGLINSRGQQDLLVYILSRGQRYDVANYPTTTIPTNIEVADSVRENFGGFYEALFSRTVEENPGAVVTEYAWPANGCDPCPAGADSALGEPDFKTLGADVIPGAENARNWLLTRMHARYAKGIDDDLVFKQVPAIEGGRETHGTENQQGARQTMGMSSFFQGRYIIRHEWSGEVKCENPRRGIWGGPPSGGAHKVSPAASRNTTGAAPKPVDLSTQIKSENVEGLKTLEGPEIELPVDALKTEVTVGEPKAVQGSPSKSKGCASADASPSGLILLLGFLGWTRRRR